MRQDPAGVIPHQHNGKKAEKAEKAAGH